MRLPAARSSERGAALLWVLLFGVLLGGAALMLPNLLTRHKEFALEEQDVFAAHMIAGDLLEIGKYLLLYEKVFYTEDPLFLTGASATRGAGLRSLWGQPFGSEDMTTACGNYDISGQMSGNGTWDGDSVFCPGLFRDSELSGANLEQLYFDQYLGMGVVNAGSRAGTYFIEMDMTDALNPARAEEAFIPVYAGQKFLDQRWLPEFLSVFGGNPITARIRFEFLSESANFRSMAAERYVRITATLLFDAKRGLRHQLQRSETIMISLSTPKDFAVFMPYPNTVGGAPTDSFAAGFAKGAFSQVNVFGRFYFNGNVDVALNTLPVFNDGAVFSGELRDETGAIPGPSALDTLRQKFPKGYVTNYSAERFLFDGACATVPIINGTQFNCPAGFGMRDYIARLGNGCWQSTVTTTCGNITSVPDPGSPAFSNAECSAALVGISPVQFVQGGVRTVNIGPACAAVATPLVNGSVQANANVYGTLFAGHLRIDGTANFYSVGSLRTGLPGIATDTVLSEFNSAAVAAYGGITVPLINLPVTLSVGEENQ